MVLRISRGLLSPSLHFQVFSGPSTYSVAYQPTLLFALVDSLLTLCITKKEKIMKAILRKGMAACAAVLMGANVMAQENVFVENVEARFSTQCYFLPQEMTSDGKSRLILPITETIEIDEGYGAYTRSFTIGWQVADKNLNVEKEFKMFTVDELNNTREIIYETSDGYADHGRRTCRNSFGWGGCDAELAETAIGQSC